MRIMYMFGVLQLNRERANQKKIGNMPIRIIPQERGCCLFIIFERSGLASDTHAAAGEEESLLDGPTDGWPPGGGSGGCIYTP